MKITTEFRGKFTKEEREGETVRRGGEKEFWESFSFLVLNTTIASTD
jgi:hypothetical protein